jgi:hypothetical protein
MTPSTRAPAADRGRPRPIRGYAAVLAVSLWSVAAWTLATPGRIDRFGTLKGIDFASSWLSGRLVSQGRADLLFDERAWREAFARLFPDVPGLLFLPNYPPQAALFFSPFGRLPFEWGVLAWTAVSLMLYSWSIRALWLRSRALADHGATVALLALGWPAFFLLALNGQNTTLVLASWTAAALAHAAGREWWMGVALGACALKPHFAIVPAVVLLAAGRWRAVAGMIAMGLAQVAVTVLALGSHVYVEYLQTSLTVLRDPTLYEPKLWQAHGLKNALDLLLGRGPLATVVYIVLAAALVWITARVWRRGQSGGLRFALLVATSTLLNPHLYGYDLVVLAPALIVSADWIVLHPDDPRGMTMRWLLVGIFLVPLVAPLAAFTHVQLSVPLLAWFWWQLATEADRARPTADL